MDIARIGRRSRHLNTLERYHIYKIYKNNLHMKDVHKETPNPIFQTVHEIYQAYPTSKRL
jgi:hypothetical protein